MNKTIEQITRYLLIFLAIFIPFRELISLFTTSFIKFVPDALIWGLFIVYMIVNRLKVSLKKYDVMFILFIGFGFVSCLMNSVSLLAFALQARSIGTMYILFYLLRNIKLDREDYDRVIKILVAVNSILIIFAIIEVLFNKEVFFPQVWADNISYVSNFYRSYSLMNNPNTFATFSLMVIVVFYIYNNKSFRWWHFFYYILVFIAIILSASRSTLIVTILFYLIILIKTFINKYYFNIIVITTAACLGIVVTAVVENVNNIFISDDQIKSNISNNNNYKNTNINNCIEVDSDDDKENENFEESGIALIDRFREIISGKTVNDSIVNGRLFILKKGIEIFSEYPLIGTGFATYGSAGSKMITPAIYEKYNLSKGFYSDNEYIKILVETGLIGTLLFGTFCLFLVFEIMAKKNYNQLLLLFIFLFIGLFYNVFEMQVLCFLLYGGLVAFDQNKISKKLNKKRIDILALHLGMGGVEQVIVNTANMLCNNYDVEIITLYNHNKPIPFKLNKKVKIKFLMNTVSNREELKRAVTNKNMINIIKEGFKAFYILVNKKRLMIGAIFNSDAKIIISTRYSFSKLLNDFGNNEQYKIHQEHTYSVNNKYINNLNKLKNIDCIMPASKTLYEKYKNKVNAELIYIPFVLNYYPTEEEKSKLNTKNLIAVGRLEKEKGFEDLLKIIDELNDKEIFLNLFGDGSLRETLKKQAKDLGIEKQVKFWGFKNQDFIKKYMLDSSLYIMTSYEESFGLVLLEAMSYGVPCISYDSAEGAKYTINEKNGYFVKNRNEKEMVKIIKEYFKLPQQKKNIMGNEAKNTVEFYNFDSVKKKWLDFIQNVLEEKNERVFKKNL